MSRPAHPWWRASREVWMFTDEGGKQVSTGITDPNDYAGACSARERILAERARSRSASPLPFPAARSRVVAEAVAAYLAARRPKLEPESWEGYRTALSVHFCAAFGGRDVFTLSADEVESWAEGRGWSSSTRHNYLGAAATWLKWCGHALSIRRPPKESRGAEVVLSEEQFARALAAYDGAEGADFRELLKVLRETGARPQEVAPLTAEAVDWANGCAVLKKHKTKRHGKTRTLHFSAAALAVLEAQRKKHKTGLLFRTTKGNAYRNRAIVRNMLRVSERVGFRCVAYGLGRHSFATKALSNGTPDAVVAALLGHSSTTMLHRNYGHVDAQSRVLKKAVDDISKMKMDG
jgi:integrase